MSSPHYETAPRRLWHHLLPALAAAAGLALTLNLGFWQLRRAEQKRALSAAIEAQQQKNAWNNDQIRARLPRAQESGAPDWLHHPVQLRGHWLAQHTLYLDNRQMRGRPGFFVLTPLRLAPPHEDVVLVVQRGWIARNFLDRSALEPVETAAGEVTVSGRLQGNPARLHEFHAGAPEAGPGARIRQNVDLARWAQAAQLPLQPWTVLQTGAPGQGLLRDWPQPVVGVERHQAYAVQWFALGALVVLLYAWRPVRHLILRFRSMPEKTAPPAPQALQLGVHHMPTPQQLQHMEQSLERRTRLGRCKMLALLLVCAAPVLASYLSYYFIRPGGQRNFGELISSQPLLPAAMAHTLQGQPVALDSLKGQWLLVSVSGGACGAQCETHLYLQRQLRESLGREKERLDWVWLVSDSTPVPASLHPALARATVLRVAEPVLAGWLQPDSGQALADHLYLVDPMGRWMMRWPARLALSDARQAKRDIDRLLRAAASWDRPGRSSGQAP